MLEKEGSIRFAAADFMDRERDAFGQLLHIINIEVSGREDLEENLKDGPAIYTLFPHTSHLDSLLVRYTLPKEERHRLVFLAKQSYWGSGLRNLAGSLTNKIIPIPTEEGSLAIHTMRESVKLLNNGISIGISPEGTRTDEEDIEKRCFLGGIGLILTLTDFKYPVVPVIIKGTNKIWPKGQNLPHPLEKKKGIIFERKKVHVHFGEPIWVPKVKRDRRFKLVELIRDRCIELYKEM
jgi:1-acyl-sn-glycerol-3-phosphate acyltransferase